MSPSEGAKAIAGVLKDGQAMEKFKATLKAQRVSESTVEALCATGADVFDVLPRAAHKTPVVALNSGKSAPLMLVHSTTHTRIDFRQWMKTKISRCTLYEFILDTFFHRFKVNEF